MKATLGRIFAKPIAHRGLHRAGGPMENSLSAAREAIAQGYAIECDVQLSADGEAMVFHDFTLDRLTDEQGLVSARTAGELESLALKGSNDTIASLPEFLATTAGRVLLVVEIKSAFSGDLRLARRVGEIAAKAAGPVAIKSFDPAPIAFLRSERAALGLEGVPLGMVAEASYEHGEWAALTPDQRRELTTFSHYERTRPDFLSWCVNDLPAATPCLFRQALNKPIMTWTVRTQAQRETAARWADQIVFENNRGEAASDDVA